MFDNPALLSLHLLPIVTGFVSFVHFNNSEKRGLPPLLSPLLSCPLPFFLCLFLSSAAGSLFTASSWREFFFMNGHKGCQRKEGGKESLCDWLSWPLTCLGRSCPKALWLFSGLCNSLLLIYSDTCSFLSGHSLRNFGTRLRALLYMHVPGVLIWFLRPWEQPLQQSVTQS